MTHPQRLRDWPPEALLQRDQRQSLRFWQLLALYFNPFPLFQKLSDKDVFGRRAAMRYNQTISNWLPAYLARWICLALLCFGMLLHLNRTEATEPFWVVLALLMGLGFSFSLTTISMIGAAWLMFHEDKDRKP